MNPPVASRRAIAGAAADTDRVNSIATTAAAIRGDQRKIGPFAALGDSAKLSLHGDWSYRSASYLDAENNPTLHVGAYSLFAANATVELDNGVSVGIGGRNLGNRKYMTGGNDDLGGLGYAEGTFAAPREWYVTARYTF